MTAITALMVKELRQRTGIGVSDCKKALVESDGDAELAIENLRKSSGMKAAKKAGRAAADRDRRTPRHHRRHSLDRSDIAFHQGASRQPRDAVPRSLGQGSTIGTQPEQAQGEPGRPLQPSDVARRRFGGVRPYGLGDPRSGHHGPRPAAGEVHTAAALRAHPRV